MDFGSILDEWDKRTGGYSAEKAGGRAAAEDTVLDDSASGGHKARAAERRRLLRKRPDAVLDLHNLTRDEAWTVMDGFFRSARDQRLEKLLIIHGKGNHSEGEAVLKRASREFIERCPFAGESGHSGVRNGGTGSTWVLLKG
jgi:DNA-nicking Smr family endonuclease